MMHNLRYYLIGVAVVLCLVGFAIASRHVKAAPPRSIKLAAGSRNGAYFKYAQRYSELLARQGLTVEVLETDGSIENLRLLKAGQADLGFAQSGLRGPDEGPRTLACLASVYLEPLWLFTRKDAELGLLSNLEGSRVAVGPDGSGTRELAVQLLSDNDLLGKLNLSPEGGDEAAGKLLGGELDAVFYVGSAQVGPIRRLASLPEIETMNFQRAPAYTRRHSSLSQVTLYQGMLDLSSNVPDHDIKMIAPAATLVVTDTFHYALVHLLLEAATEVHREAGAFQDHGEFPSPKFCTFPLREEATRYFARGPSFLYRHLPFYVAAAADRLFILSLPFLTLLLPLIRFLPPVYGYAMKSRIYSRYKKLQAIETEIGNTERDKLLERLDQLENESHELNSLPPAHQSHLFLFRAQLKETRQRLLRDETQSTRDSNKEPQSEG